MWNTFQKMMVLGFAFSIYLFWTVYVFLAGDLSCKDPSSDSNWGEFLPLPPRCDPLAWTGSDLYLWSIATCGVLGALAVWGLRRWSVRRKAGTKLKRSQIVSVLLLMGGTALLTVWFSVVAANSRDLHNDFGTPEYEAKCPDGGWLSMGYLPPRLVCETGGGVDRREYDVSPNPMSGANKAGAVGLALVTIGLIQPVVDSTRRNRARWLDEPLQPS